MIKISTSPHYSHSILGVGEKCSIKETASDEVRMGDVEN